jgi:hypothetical protein
MREFGINFTLECEQEADGHWIAEVPGASHHCRGRGRDTMNRMDVDGHHAKIEYDEETDHFRGEILGISGKADFYGSSPDELRREFRQVQSSNSSGTSQEADNGSAG